KGSNSSYRETVLAVGADDEVVKLTRKYTKAQALEEGKVVKLPYEGKTVVIEKMGDKFRFTIDGGEELTGKDAERLDKEFNAKDKSGLGKKGKDFEKMLLPKGKVAVGESWKIDAAPLLDEIKKSGEIVVDADKFSMTARLTKAYPKGGRQFGVIRLELFMP